MITKWQIFDIMIRLEKTFSASVQAPAAIVWECAACKQGVNDNDGGGGATAQWPNIVWSRISTKSTEIAKSYSYRESVKMISEVLNRFLCK